MKLTFTLNIFSITELQKAMSKHIQISFSLEDSWDTIKTDAPTKILLAQLTIAHNFEDYSITYYIHQHILKLGLLLASESNYTILLETLQDMKQTLATTYLNINRTNTAHEDDKENHGPEGKADKKKKVHTSYMHVPTIYNPNLI